MKLPYKITMLLALTAAGFASVGFAFHLSERELHYDNRFIRRFPPHVADEFGRMELDFNSYYFAGTSGGVIYLGNVTAPLQVLVIDTMLRHSEVKHIELVEKDLPFRSPQVRVSGRHFYVYEGSVPYLYRGITTDWKASLTVRGGAFFSQVQPIDSTHLAIRYIEKNGQSLIGLLNLEDTSKVTFAPQMLQKQIDGVFDTDGSLHAVAAPDKIIYNYRYRNQYIIADPDFNYIVRGNTIDTITKAQISLSKVTAKGYTTFTAPPLIVNKCSAVRGDYLFVNSLLRGNYEPKGLWENASIIDVYEMSNQTYRSSFPLYHSDGNHLREFIVTGNKVFAIIGTKLVGHNLRESYKQVRP